MRQAVSALRARRSRRRFLLTSLLPAGLAAGFIAPFPGGALADENNVLRLAVTTTTDNTGLISYLIPFFEDGHGFTVRVMAGGSGKALRLLANGDVDVAVTHARELELPLIAGGDAIERHEIMSNEFIIVGPAADPAGIRDAATAADAMAAITRSHAQFVSRGDRSGTHIRELQLWRQIGIEPQRPQYLETGQGMGQTLQIAAELDAYTLVDSGTWLKFGRQTPLARLFRDPTALRNIYSVLRANPARHPDVNERGARVLCDWLRSAETGRLIDAFRIGDRRPFNSLVPSR